MRGTRLMALSFLAVVVAADLSGAAAAGGQAERLAAFARQTLHFVERSAPRAELAGELAALDKRIAEVSASRKADDAALADEARRLRRRIILSHPALDFDRILINLRTCRIPGHMCDQYLGRHSTPGPGLAVLESWKDDPKCSVLLADKLPKGMTMHPDLSFDGKRVLFGFCDHERTTNRDQRGYFIYEAAIDGSHVKQLTGTPADPMVGWKGRQTVLIEDFDPTYLPDGGFAFISTRSQQFGRCHGSRYVPAYVLYRAEADGSSIRQLSFNEANEWDPAVLHDGRIVYTRWDYINRHDTNFQSLWVMRPDGTATGHYYGNYSVGPCMIAEARAIPNSHKVVATATDHHGYTAGSIIVIDPYAGQDGGEPLVCVTPEIGFPERGAPPGTFFAPRPLPEYDRDVPTSSRRSGRAATPFPLTEDLFLAAIQSGEQYGIYLIDTLGGRELIYQDPQWSCFAPMPIRPTPVPPAPAPAMDAGPGAKTGRFLVQNVYRSTEPIEPGSIRRIRISEIISQPTRSKPILSYVNNEIIKRILGTVPVSADGSAAFEAPARTPLQFQLLDANGMAVMTMRSLVYVQPGEMAGCVGCHEPRQDAPVPAHRPADLKFRRPDPPAGPRYEGGFSFVRTVQPVLDRYCIGCHGLHKTEGGVNLLGTPSDASKRGQFTASYDSIMSRGGMVRIAQRNSETPYSKPRDYFAHAGKLAAMLLAGHRDKNGKPRVQLDRQGLQRIIDWLDLNAQFYGDYSFNRVENQRPSADGEKALRKRVEELFGGELAAQPFAALVNIALPGESRILLAPLRPDAGGWGQIDRNGWKSTSDAGYREMLRLVEASIPRPQWQDLVGTCGRQGCSCGCCWVRQMHQAAQEAPKGDAPAKTASVRQPDVPNAATGVVPRVREAAHVRRPRRQESPDEGNDAGGAVRGDAAVRGLERR